MYETGTLAEFNNCFDPAGASSKSRIRPIAGNHDWGNTTPGSLAGYFGYFGALATDAGGKSYYSYDLDANWHVVNLDSECANVDRWLRRTARPSTRGSSADLAANASKNVIAVWHKPSLQLGLDQPDRP